MKKIGITGQNGFIGGHLYNFLNIQKDKYVVVPFERDYLSNKTSLEDWVKKCDVIVHLAALNRHAEPNVIHDTNIQLTKNLLDVLNTTRHKVHFVFSSSTQEERNNEYGLSKRTSRELVEKWSAEADATFTGLIVPNVFGSFGKPFYNSVVATFCYQLCNNLEPRIDIDGILRLIYIDELVEIVISTIDEERNDPAFYVQNTAEIKVSDLLNKLISYKELYLDNGIIPLLPDKFSVNLFNTFRSYLDYKTYFPCQLKKNTDQRGTFVELIKLNVGGQVSFSTTFPGITRGNHFHTRKIERFLVIKGNALIQLRKYNSDEILNFELNGNEPAYVDMPIWYTHNIKNTGNEELYTIFWINEFFDAKNPDTYFETV